jgi:hypothetical protein
MTEKMKSTILMDLSFDCPVCSGMAERWGTGERE